MPHGSPQDDHDTVTRPVAFRGAGFTPKAGRYSGWMALALVIGLWQLADSTGWVNPLFLPAPSAMCAPSISGHVHHRAIDHDGNA
jgi:NitT/TauT family transport system permease protein